MTNEMDEEGEGVRQLLREQLRRIPLSVTTIALIAQAYGIAQDMDAVINYTRAIERSHGIGGVDVDLG